MKKFSPSPAPAPLSGPFFRKWQIGNFPHKIAKPWFSTFAVFTKYRCCNPSKWPQMPQKWVNIIPFGWGHILGTLNHGLGPLFCCFITLFGAGGTLDPPGAPWCPLAPPWTAWCPHDPWYVILGYIVKSSWPGHYFSHIWPIWSE